MFQYLSTVALGNCLVHQTLKLNRLPICGGSGLLGLMKPTQVLCQAMLGCKCLQAMVTLELV
jgi:hypothetical protein